jgi:hypothetical protein
LTFSSIPILFIHFSARQSTARGKSFCLAMLSFNSSIACLTQTGSRESHFKYYIGSDECTKPKKVLSRGMPGSRAVLVDKHYPCLNRRFPISYAGKGRLILKQGLSILSCYPANSTLNQTQSRLFSVKCITLTILPLTALLEHCVPIAHRSRNTRC